MWGETFSLLYWHASEPGQGYDLKAAEWREKLQALEDAEPGASPGDDEHPEPESTDESTPPTETD